MYSHFFDVVGVFVIGLLSLVMFIFHVLFCIVYILILSGV